MKRLLCILSGMNAGGAETFLMKMYRSIDSSKYQMDFCINEQNECFYENEIKELGGKIYRIPAKSQSIKLFKNGLSDCVKSGNYKYVLRITSSAMGFMDLKIAKKSGAEICSARSSNSNDGKSTKATVAHVLGKLLYRKYVDVKIAPSDLAAKYTFGKKAYRCGDIHILHNALDLNVYQFDEEARNNIRKEFSISDNVRIIGHVGRFSKQKNHSFLLDVFNEIHKQNHETILMLVGKGELEGEIKEKIKALNLENSVIFTGVRSDIPALLSAMDVFVFPSFYEGMPNTVIEAQATGLPCVIADTITKEAKVTEAVQYLPPENPSEWARVALNAATANRLSTSAVMAEKGYAVDSVCKEFVRLVFGEE
mgnify:CR=1 FL=1